MTFYYNESPLPALELGMKVKKQAVVFPLSVAADVRYSPVRGVLLAKPKEQRERRNVSALDTFWQLGVHV